MSSSGIIDFARERSYPTPIQNSPLLTLLLLSLASQRNTPKTKTEFKDKYDYIIIGSGAGGSVVASRLSEKPCVSVLLLEAGKHPPLVSEVPVFQNSLVSSDLDWKYITEPQKHAAKLMENQQVSYPCGKGIGGSTLINYMLYVRGNRKDYDGWQSSGAEGWSYKQVYPFFLKAEANKDMDIFENGYHNAGGPMTVERFPSDTEFIGPSKEAQNSLGFPFIDINDGSQIGAADFQGNIRGAQRCSVAKGYLVPAENRTNLDIVAEAFVTKIIIRHKTAVGVQFDFNGTRHRVEARREVILSAGAVNSAQLLMLSGIGPQKTLKRFGIPSKAELPVGQNFHDHCFSILFFNVESGVLPLDRKAQKFENVLRYINNRTGILASPAGIYGFTFWKADGLNTDPKVPDYQLYFMETPSIVSAKTLRLSESNFEKLYGPYKNGTNIWCISQVLHPQSRGNVSIRSTNPYDKPVIDPNYLDVSRDAEVIASGLKTCRKIFEQSEFKHLKVKEFKTVMPGCESFDRRDDKYLECHARSITRTIFHPVGTARMGNLKEESTVVDPELRVKGIEGLRVIDASVMPSIPAANTNNPVIMIGEKASDLIKKHIKCC